MLTESAGAPRGVYVITPDWTDTARLSAAVAGAIRGGAGAVQYRNKAASAALRAEQAEALARLTQSAGLPFFVDDDPILAAAVGADGLHIGRDDGDVVAVRAKLPPGMLLGVSCYGDLDRVVAAVEGGAAYVAIGVMYPSRTKAGVRSVPVERIGQARRLGACVVASGGIGAGSVAQMAEAGADAVGVVSAVFEAQDPESATAALTARFAMGAGQK